MRYVEFEDYTQFSPAYPTHVPYLYTHEKQGNTIHGVMPDVLLRSEYIAKCLPYLPAIVKGMIQQALQYTPQGLFGVIRGYPSWFLFSKDIVIGLQYLRQTRSLRVSVRVNISAKSINYRYFYYMVTPHLHRSWQSYSHFEWNSDTNYTDTTWCKVMGRQHRPQARTAPNRFSTLYTH